MRIVGSAAAVGAGALVGWAAGATADDWEDEAGDDDEGDEQPATAIRPKAAATENRARPTQSDWFAIASFP